MLPRKPRAAWTAREKRRAQALYRKGKLLPAGAAMVDRAKRNGRWYTTGTE